LDFLSPANARIFVWLHSGQEVLLGDHTLNAIHSVRSRCSRRRAEAGREASPVSGSRVRIRFSG
jgi:hypothetical protein